MRPNRWITVLPVSLALLLGACSSGPTPSVAEGAKPEEVYLDAVCGSGQERVLFALLAQGYQQNQGIDAQQVLEQAGIAVTSTERAVEMLRSPNVAWPAAVTADVEQVASKEEVIAGDLGVVAGADSAGLDEALEVFFNRPDNADGSGERVRSELGLGKPGDCPVSPTSERAFVVLVQRFAPTVYERGNEAVLALGREACVIRGLGLSTADETKQLMDLDLTEAQAGVVVEAAIDNLCPESTTDAGAPDTKAQVDAVLDRMIDGTLILTQRSPAGRPEVIAQFEDARAEWAAAADLLASPLPGVPADVQESVLGALEQTLDAMTNVLSCLQSSSTSSCDSEISTNSRLSNELGQELATLIPYGTRSGEEVLAEINGESSGGSSAGGSTSGTAPNSVSQANALEKALQYLAYSAFSRQGLIDQLKYEGFSDADATYGADSAGADWNQQAALKAQEYLDYTSFSRSGLIEQLQFEGFTLAQATYGADAVGL
jgi:hypothetical protein